ncbi:RNA methyltransferase [Candidatus Dependentiae bacterium]|nr:RNA methyltransferase [Candidatus Dependentiae bacterium]
MLILHSTAHATVKSVVRLHDSKERKARKLCIVEGVRTLTSVLEGGLILEALYCTEEQTNQAHALVSPQFITLVSDQVMQKMSSSVSPSGLLGVFRIPKSPPHEELSSGLVLAQIADPGNMGTLIRTAAACGVRSVVVIEGTDPWSPKVIQASAGTCATLQIFQWDWETLITVKKDLQLYALVVEGGTSPTLIDPSHALLVVGNEAHGIPSLWLKQCDSVITLPMPGKTESLNAAVAGSLALYFTFVLKNV